MPGEVRGDRRHLASNLKAAGGLGEERSSKICCCSGHAMMQHTAGRGDAFACMKVLYIHERTVQHCTYRSSDCVLPAAGLSIPQILGMQSVLVLATAMDTVLLRAHPARRCLPFEPLPLVSYAPGFSLTAVLYCISLHPAACTKPY